MSLKGLYSIFDTA